MNKSFRLFQKIQIWGEKNSYKNRLLSIGILAVNLPLISCTVYLLFHPQFALRGEVFALLFLSTIASFLLLNRKIKQIEKSIIMATKALNCYSEKVEILELPSSNYYEIDNLFKAIYYTINKTEEKFLDVENIIWSRQEESFQIVLEQESAETHLRQCLGIASRHHLPLCIALVSIENMDSIKNPDFSITPPSEIITLIQQLQQLLRESDWVAHWGNNEFLLAIFSELPGTKLAIKRIFNNLFTQEESPPNSPPQSYIYIGCTTVQPNEHYRACLERTNQALQQAKTTGERCVYL